MIPTLPPGHPARLRPADLLPADQPFKPVPPVHRWRFSSWVRLLVFIAAAGATATGLVLLGLVRPVGDLVARNYWLISLVELGAAVVGYAVLLLVEKRRPVELSPRRWGGLGWGLLLGAGLCALVIGLLAVVGSYRVVGVDAGYQVLPALVTAGVVAAIAEEIAFRGVLFRIGEDVFGTWGAVALSTVVFGLAHLSNPDATLWGAVAIALEAGVLFAALYAVTRSLWWTMGLHFAWNMMQGPVFGSAVSGSGRASGWLRAEFTGPDWLTGGSFGIEASVLTVVLLTAVGVWLLRVVHRERLAVSPVWVRRRRLREAAVSTGGLG